MKDQHDLLNMREQLSAMADGELQGEGFAQAMRHAGHQEAQACWQVYHLIGDTLRQGQAVRPMTDPALLQRLRAQMASEAPSRTLATAPLQSVAPAASAAATSQRAANDPVLRWKLAAGFASLAAVAVLGWHAYTALPGGVPAGAQLASAQPKAVPAAPAAQDSVTTVARSEAAPAGEAPVMIRDPRLDELLAAHRQLGNSTAALQMPAGFLRNASFAGRER